MSQLFLRTLRDDPADAEVDSHRLLVRAGYIRKVASGIYSWLPLGNRVLRKVEQIVREEMDAGRRARRRSCRSSSRSSCGSAAGRDAAVRAADVPAPGPQGDRVLPRRRRPRRSSPPLVAGEYSSYRDLPVNLYQINWKYRDELRPRFGLLRAREFLMKDAYSFDRDLAGLPGSRTTRCIDAYEQVFTRCGLTFRSVKAQSGEIGGDTSQEFMAVAAVGEDAFVWCEQLRLRREHRSRDASRPTPDDRRHPRTRPRTRSCTRPTCPASTTSPSTSGRQPNQLLKCIAFDVDGELGLALVPGDREVNEFALDRAFPGATVRLYDRRRLRRAPRAAEGLHRPRLRRRDASSSPTRRSARRTAGSPARTRSTTTSRDTVLGRDFTPTQWAEIVVVEPGDAVPELRAATAHRPGHRGRSRLPARHQVHRGARRALHRRRRRAAPDGDGLLRHRDQPDRRRGRRGAPRRQRHRLARARSRPYDVHLIAMPGDESREPRPRSSAPSCSAAGLDVLYDDRDARPGVKFADADLLGVPVQIIVGAKGLARGIVERKVRATGERDELPRDAVGRHARRGA